MSRPLVLLHGWGMAPSIWNEVRERLGARGVHPVAFPGYENTAAPVPYTLDAMVDRLVDACDGEVDLVGWSLGAQVAMRWATRYPERVRRLVLLAATPRFVADAEWPHGVASSVFRAFTTRLRREPDALLDHFCALQSQGEPNPATIAAALGARRAVASEAALGDSLAVLGATDLRDDSPQQPMLLLHGANDAVTPVTAAQWLAAHCRSARLEVFPDAGHALPLSRAAECAQRIEEFIEQ